MLDWMLKQIIQRPRPPGALVFLHGESFSFPSGHAMGSVLGYGMLAYLLVRFWATRWKAQTFVPTGKNERDNATELELKAKLEQELPIEQDLTRWLALFDAPL